MLSGAAGIVVGYVLATITAEGGKLGSFEL
jgi:hypothetical protein